MSSCREFNHDWNVPQILIKILNINFMKIHYKEQANNHVSATFCCKCAKRYTTVIFKPV